MIIPVPVEITLSKSVTTTPARPVRVISPAPIKSKDMPSTVEIATLRSFADEIDRRLRNWIIPFFYSKE